VGISLTSKIERKVYDAIDEISEEFKLNFNLYPEVYWVYPGLSFDNLGISRKYKTYYSHMKKEKRSMFLPKPWSIWIAENSPIDIYEESGHAIHYKESEKPNLHQKKEDSLSTHTLIEMMGYFCSKIGDSSRLPIFKDIPDIVFEPEKCIKKLTGKQTRAFYIYQQSHDLGEKLFNAYISGIISKRNIRNLFRTNLNGENTASIVFLRFKYDILNFEGRKPPKNIQKILQN